MLSKPRELLMLGALLHDIGKISQRANNNPKSDSHLRFGFNFLKDKITFDFEKETEILLRFPLAHHGLQKYKELDNEKNTYIEENFDEIKLLYKIVEKADKLSAGERISEDETLYKEVDDANIKTPLKSIISKVNIPFRQKLDLNENSNVYYSIDEINYSSIVPKKRDEIISKNQENLIQNYKIIENKIKNSLILIKEQDFKKYYSKVETILLKYTKLIPSSTYNTEPDISFYDHSKTTSAIAISIYDYLKEEKNITKLNEGEKIFYENQPYFILLRAELSGIQKYIYYTFDATKTIKGSAKRLRAKSFKLILLLDSISNKIIDDLNLSTSNILLNGGGSFEILLPNTKKVKEYLEKIENEIQYLIKNQFGNQLYLTMVWKECTSEDLSANKNSYSSYKNTRAELAKLLQQKKNQPFHKIINSEFFNTSTEKVFLSNIKIEELCSSCGLKEKKINNKDGEDENELCADCYKEQEFGAELLKHDSIYRNYEEGIKIGFHYYSFNPLNSDYFEISLHGKKEYKDLSIIPDQILFVGNFAYQDENKIAEFEKLAQGKGVQRIGIIKGDVDYLGEIFIRGLSNEEYTISRVNTLSTMLNLFFAYKINEIVKETKSYILYSGGDDFVIISNWADSFYLINNINKEFKKYCSFNPSFTISTGNFIVKPKFPLIRAVKYSEELLEKSKHNYERKENEIRYDKDSVTIFGCTTKTSEYEKQVNFAEYLMSIKKEISSGTIYTIIREWNNSFSCIKSNTEKKTIKKHVPIIYYMFSRNIENKKIREELLQKLFIENLFDDAIIASSYVNLLNREN
ncbi:MAG: type III-A CRISPR-associated protein Cas10/Csm1 [Candidatus Woesearchaeota archaeon]